MTTPAAAPIRRRFPESPLETSPPLFLSPPEFMSSIRLLQERTAMLRVLMSKMLWPEEREAVAQVCRTNEMDVVWDETEKGPPLIIPANTGGKVRVMLCDMSSLHVIHMSPVRRTYVTGTSKLHNIPPG